MEPQMKCVRQIHQSEGWCVPLTGYFVPVRVWIRAGAVCQSCWDVVVAAAAAVAVIAMKGCR